MKLVRVLLVLLLMGFAAVAAKADGVVDPKITIGGGGSCEEQSLTSLTQSFTGLTTGCMIDFQNNISNDDSGVTLFQIVVNITSAFSGPLSCEVGEGSPFNNAVVSSATSCTFSASFADDEFFEEELSGLGPGGVFSLTFDTNFGPTVDTTLSQNVITTPEPASALLLLSGAGALFAFRKRRQATA